MALPLYIYIAIIVGYSSSETPASGNIMIGGQFLKVDSTTKFVLSDLSMTGYDPDEGAWGSSRLTVLDNSGRAAKDKDGNKMAFLWYDCDDEGPKKGWYMDDDTTKWPDDYTFDAGQGFWVQGEGLTLVGAGAVNFESVTVSTPTSGNAALGNPYPTPITLGDISMSGYDPEEGAWGSARMTVLDNSGRAAKDKDNNKMAFLWYDCDDGFAKIGWYMDDDTTKWDDSYSFPAGQGFWVQGEGCAVEFTFPASK